jgi:hypothetical protein
MRTLKTLTFAATPTSQKNPTMARRAKLIAHLEEQKQLFSDPLHVRVVQRWVIQDNGVKSPVELKKRVRPWWRTDDAGAVYLKVRYGARAVEFEKGKPAILIKDKSKLVPTIDTLISAVLAGELDEQLAQHASLRVARPSKVTRA